MSTLHTHLDAARKSELTQDQAEYPRRAHPVQADDPVLRALSTAEAAFTRYSSHHLRQANQPGEDKAKRLQQAGENNLLAQAMQKGILAHFTRSHEVPQGWKLAPCEPTREMLNAMHEAAIAESGERVSLRARAAMYAALLSATPKLVTEERAQRDKHGAAVALLRAYLADFLDNASHLPGNNILMSLDNDGWLDLALQAVRTGDLQRAADALRQAAEEAAEPVIVWPGDTADCIENAQQERKRIALAVSVACALLEKAKDGAA